jgi:hypothetical protein
MTLKRSAALYGATMVTKVAAIEPRELCRKWPYEPGKKTRVWEAMLSAGEAQGDKISGRR